MELFTYLLKITGCMAAFYIVYYTLLRKLTFFSLNRWYLLSALAISLIIPALHIGVQTFIPAPDVTPVAVNTTSKTIVDTGDVEINTIPTTTHINWFLVGACAYWAVASLLLVKLVLSLCGIVYKAIKRGERQSGYSLVNGSANNSSFFNYIFLNDYGLDAAEKEQVIAHELVHVKRLHSVDNLFMEVLKAILWFNPFVYLFAKALHQVHEFEVDSDLTHRYNSKNYAGLLLKLSSPGAVGLVNQFSAYGLKSRIGMLFSKPSAAPKKLNYLLALPLIAGLVYFLAVEKVYAYDVSNKGFVLVLDAGHSGNTGSRLNGVKEADIALTMAKQIKLLAEQRGIKTILTRTDDKDVSLNNRLIPQGDVFVSIHVNYIDNKDSERYNGIGFLISKNENYERSQKLADAFMVELKQLHGIATADTVAHNQHVKVLRGNKAPAILVELGYLSNKSDLQYITNKQNQHDMAEKFVDAVIAYKKTATPKMSGMVVKPDTGLKIRTWVALSKTKERKKTAKADTANKISAKTKQDTIKLRSTKMVMSKTVNEDDIAKGDASVLYDEFKGAKLTSFTSTTVDVSKDMVTLNDGLVTTPKFNITANFIRMSKRDSIVFAAGHVHLKVKDDDSKKPEMIFDLDTLTIDLKYHFKKKEATAH